MLIQVNPAGELLELIRTMIRLNALELLMLPGEAPALRIDGEIERQDGDPLEARQLEAMTSQLFGSEQVAALGSSHGLLRGIASLDGNELERPGETLRIMFSASRSLGEVSLAARLAAYRIVEPAEIGLPQAVMEAANAPNGLLIFTGPTGSGKTTAAAAVMEHLNATKKLHICLLDDPMQFLLQPKQSILQHKDLYIDMPDFVSGLTAAMAQDIDVIYLAEIRTLEELRMCLTIAQTGHLVVTVLHANNPVDAIERVRRAFPEDMREAGMGDFADALRCITALRLLRRSGGRGRVAAYSVLVPDTLMRRAIAGGVDPLQRDEALPPGNLSFRESIEGLVANGAVSVDEAARILADLAD